MTSTRSLHLPLALSFGLAVSIGLAILSISPARACPPPLLPPPPIEQGPRGRLTVRTTPEARVFIDGRPAGRTPVVGRYLDAGRHQLRLQTSCGSAHRTIRVPPGNDVHLSLALCRGVPDDPAPTP